MIRTVRVVKFLQKGSLTNQFCTNPFHRTGSFGHRDNILGIHGSLFTHDVVCVEELTFILLTRNDEAHIPRACLEGGNGQPQLHEWP